MGPEHFVDIQQSEGSAMDNGSGMMDFRMQASNPRYMKTMDPDDEMSSDAVQTVFPLSTEMAIMVWNGVYVPLSYKYDFGIILEDVISMLEALLQVDSGAMEIHWPSNTFACIWRMKWSGQHLEILSEWSSVMGSTEALLQERSVLAIDRNAFIAEWKQILWVILNALAQAGYGATNLSDFSRLQKCHDDIHELGVLYRS